MPMAASSASSLPDEATTGDLGCLMAGERVPGDDAGAKPITGSHIMKVTTTC